MNVTPPTVRQEDLIFDVGMHAGHDTAFYLAKGFRVVAIEADPDLAAAGRKRFAKEIAAGQLRLLNVAVHTYDGTVTFYQNKAFDVWGTVSAELADRNLKMGTASQQIEVPCRRFAGLLQEHGVPYYAKIDIEGNDHLCLQGLAELPVRPRHVSVETNLSDFDGSLDQLAVLWTLGYRRLKVVNQMILHRLRMPQPAREGKYVDYQFREHCSGPFGEETPGEWLTFEQVFKHVPWLIHQYSLWGDSGRFGQTPLRRVHRIASRLVGREPIGWYDFHAKLDETARV